MNLNELKLFYTPNRSFYIHENILNKEMPKRNIAIPKLDSMYFRQMQINVIFFKNNITQRPTRNLALVN